MGGCIHPDCPEHPLCSLRCLAAEDPLSLQSMKEFRQCWMLALREFAAMERIPPMELGWISWKGFLCPQPSPSHGCSQPSHSSSLRTCSPIFPQSQNPRAWKSPPGSSSPTFDQPPPCHQPRALSATSNPPQCLVPTFLNPNPTPSLRNRPLPWSLRKSRPSPPNPGRTSKGYVSAARS